MIYRKTDKDIDEFDRSLPLGTVVAWPNKCERVGKEWICTFLCPCGHQTMHLADHTVTFDDEGIMTVKESMINRPEAQQRDGFVCHFFIRQGKVQMVNDSTCPGMKK